MSTAELLSAMLEALRVQAVHFRNENERLRARYRDLEALRVQAVHVSIDKCMCMCMCVV